MRFFSLFASTMLAMCLTSFVQADINFQHSFNAAAKVFKKLDVPAGELVTVQFIGFAPNADYFCQLNASHQALSLAVQEVAFGDFENYAIHFEGDAGFISVETKANEKGNTMVTLVLQNNGREAASFQVNCEGHGVGAVSAESSGEAVAGPSSSNSADASAFPMPVPTVYAREKLVEPDHEPTPGELTAARVSVRNTFAYEVSIDFFVERLPANQIGKAVHYIVKKDSIAPFSQVDVELPMVLGETLSLKIRARINDVNFGGDFNQHSISRTIKSPDVKYELFFDESGKMVFTNE